MELDYKDEQGRWFHVKVPDGQEDMAQHGIRIGPPELDELELPLDLEVQLNNQLFARGLLTLADVRRRPADIEAALKAILRIDVLRIKHLYGR